MPFFDFGSIQTEDGGGCGKLSEAFKEETDRQENEREMEEKQFLSGTVVLVNKQM